MSQFGTKEEIIKSIEGHFSQMQSGKLSMEDLEELVSQARELYERTLILRYKAYEVKVFGEEKDVEVEFPSSMAPVSSEIEELINETEEEIVPEINETEEEIVADQEVENEDSEPIFDFALFDKKPEEKIQEEEKVEIPEEETISFEQEEVETENITFEEEEESIPEIIEGKLEEEIIEKVEEKKPEPSRSFMTQNDSTTIFNKILESDNSLGSVLMSSKLETLIGSFGFNEKYQCIQELFNASSEEFNEAIDILDNLQNLDQAKNQLEFYVDNNKWDLESELVAEFVTKVARRYK